MAGSSLGTFWVEFVAKGAESTIRATEAVQKSAEKAATAIGTTMATAARTAAGTLLGLATAGMIGTQEGNRLAWSFQMLGREIAAVALPAINGTIKALQTATMWFRELNGTQQTTIFKFAGLATGLTLLGTGLGTIPGAILTAVSAFTLWRDASDSLKSALSAVAIVTGGLMVATGVGALPGALLASAGAAGLLHDKLSPIAEWFKGIGESLKQAFGGITQRFSELGASFRGLFESIGAMTVKLTPLVVAGFYTIANSVNMVIVALKELSSILQGVIDRFTAWMDNEIVQKLMLFVQGYQMAVSVAGKMRSDRIAKEAGFAVGPAGAQKPDEPHRSMTPVGGGFESITASYSRIQQGVLQKDMAKQQLDEAKRTNDWLALIAKASQSAAQGIRGVLPA